MRECVVCGGPATVFSRSCSDGPVCKTCMNRIPDVIKKKIGKYSGLTLKKIRDFQEKHRKDMEKTFEATSSYGLLHIDEIHGLFTICKKTELEDGRISTVEKSIPSVFPALYIRDYGITYRVVSSGEDKVTIEVSLMVEMESLDYSFTTPIKTAYCYAERVDDEHISYREPSELSMFRSMFHQMIVTSVEKYNREINRKFITPKEFDLFCARQMFMLPEDFTMKELKAQRNRYLKVYHPDENTEKTDLSGYTQKINKAYRLLKDSCTERGKEN